MKKPNLRLPRNVRYLRIAPDLPPGAVHLDQHRTIRYGTPADLAYVKHLQNIHHDACGYSPPAALAERLATKRILLLLENETPGGWVSFTHRVNGVTHLPQMAIDSDLWRTRAGTVLARTLFDLARASGSFALTLRSAQDIQANLFWPSLGMIPTAVAPGRARTLIHWALRFDGQPPGALRTPKPGGPHKWGKSPIDRP